MKCEQLMSYLETLNKVRTIIDDLKVQSFEEEVLSVESILHDANFFIFKNKKCCEVIKPGQAIHTIDDIKKRLIM